VTQKVDVVVRLANHPMKRVDDLQHVLIDWLVDIPSEAQLLRGTNLVKGTTIPGEASASRIQPGDSPPIL
jgi:hypothetical protein